MYKFVSIDRIDSMRIQAKQQCHLPEATAAVNKVVTRMNLIHDFVWGAQNQGTLIAYLPTCEPFKKYYDKRTTQEKSKIDGIFQRCNHMRWERMDFLTSSLLTVHFKRLHKKVCCMSSVPLSAYILLCQAMRNEINKGLNAENGKFNRLLGEGAAQQVADMIKPRFNMNGENPDGRKVGLVDPHQIWAFMADPYNHSWRSKFAIEGSFPVHVRNMIEHYVPLDGDGSDKTHQAVKKDFLASLLLSVMLHICGAISSFILNKSFHFCFLCFFRIFGTSKVIGLTALKFLFLLWCLQISWHSTTKTLHLMMCRRELRVMMASKRSFPFLFGLWPRVQILPVGGKTSYVNAYSRVN